MVQRQSNADKRSAGLILLPKGNSPETIPKPTAIQTSFWELIAEVPKDDEPVGRRHKFLGESVVLVSIHGS